LVAQKFIQTLFKKIILTITQKVLIPSGFSININNSFNLFYFFNIPKFGKLWDVTGAPRQQLCKVSSYISPARHGPD
jgi:hypothetical protein